MNESDAALLSELCSPCVTNAEAFGVLSATAPTVAKPSRAPVAFALWHRARGGKWRKVATGASRAELVPLMTNKGDYWLAELHDERLAG